MVRGGHQCQIWYFPDEDRLQLRIHKLERLTVNTAADWLIALKSSRERIQIDRNMAAFRRTLRGLRKKLDNLTQLASVWAFPTCATRQTENRDSPAVHHWTHITTGISNPFKTDKKTWHEWWYWPSLRWGEWGEESSFLHSWCDILIRPRIVLVCNLVHVYPVLLVLGSPWSWFTWCGVPCHHSSCGARIYKRGINKSFINPCVE